ncbi:MAG: hypothetical protein ABIH72_05415 [archaeon]
MKDKIKKIAEKAKELLYWDLFYTIGYSSSAGLANGLANSRGDEDFSEGFGQAYCNNFPLGIAMNLAYPLVFNQLKKTKHYRLYSNLFTIAVNTGFLAWHHYAGTEHPIEAMGLNTAIGLAMANRNVSETKNLETEVVEDFRD